MNRESGAEPPREPRLSSSPTKVGWQAFIALQVQRILKFASVGGITTVLSFSLNFFFLKIIGTPLYPTYITVYLSMVGLSLYLNSKWTFGKKISHKKKLLYFGIYFQSFVLALITLTVWKSLVTVENWIYPLLVLPVTASVNFVLTSWLFKDRSR